jgi:hypothetical protein
VTFDIATCEFDAVVVSFTFVSPVDNNKDGVGLRLKVTSGVVNVKVP